MSSPNPVRSWLDSRHLRDSPEGARALELFERLDSSNRSELLEHGDRLACHSVALAHIYFVSATRAYEELGQRRKRWERQGFELLGESGSGREAAQSYFTLDPKQLDRISDAAYLAWAAAVAGVGAHSRRLATRFVETCGKALCAHPRIEAGQVESWQQASRKILAAGGWRGEFLASGLIDSMQCLLPLLAPGAVEAWASIVSAFGASGRSPRIPPAPKTLAASSLPQRTRALELCAKIAAIDPHAAVHLLEKLPLAMAALPSRACERLIDALAECGTAADTSDAVGMIPAMVRGIPDDDLDRLYSHLAELSGGFPAGISAYLRHIDRAFEESGGESIDLWVARGIEIAERNPAAGLAHFRLQSRTSHKILTQHSTAVAFEEVEALLLRYLLMMSRRSFQFLASSGIWYRPMLTPPEDTTLRLPERIDICRTAEENQSLYKLTVAHIAGRWEYGTYDFLCEELMERGSSLPDSEAAQRREREDIIGFLDSFPNPLLASALFVLLDGVRIDACLERDFAVLRDELDRMGRFYAANPRPEARDRYGERLLEALFMMSVGRLNSGQLEPRLRRQGQLLESTLEVLRSAQATVYDSAALLLSYYGSLQFAEVTAGDEDGDAMFGDFGGATVIDPFEYLDGEDGAVAGGDASEAAADGDDSSAGERFDEGSVELELSPDQDGEDGGRPISAEQLRRLLESGVDIEISEARGEVGEGLGLYITDLMGKVPAEVLEQLRNKIAKGDHAEARAWLSNRGGNDYSLYDEWDYTIRDYRRRWCRVYEVDCSCDTGEYFSRFLARSDDLIQRVRHGFQSMRPEQFVKVRRMRDGDDFDLNALVEAHAERRNRKTPSERLYIARRREQRDVATLFLVDMSASTDEPLPGESGGGPGSGEASRRVIDLTKDTLALMSQVLEEIGDAYAVYGFSGHGKDNVEIFPVKSFGERLSDKVKARLGGIEPKRSTRMGAALRHSSEKLARVSAKSKHLILLSDGFPQDFDYGDDRRSNIYGIRDTMTALQEVEREGVRSFCITVDPAGHDYLRDMCPVSQYAVIANIAELPEELPRIYRQVTRL